MPENIQCECGNPVTHRQVKKEGQNHGKWFYACAISKEKGGCGYFKWNTSIPPGTMEGFDWGSDPSKRGKVTRASLGLAKKRKHNDTITQGSKEDYDWLHEGHPDCIEEEEEESQEKRIKSNTVNINLLTDHVLKLESDVTEQLKKLNGLFLNYLSTTR